MKKYEYVSVVYEGVYASQVNEHRQIIDKRAAEGWRYVGYIPIDEVMGKAVIRLYPFNKITLFK